MDESTIHELEEGLGRVMKRFRDSFLGEGIHLSEDKVPFRERPDFVAPLVTVLGHTYGLRLVTVAKGEAPTIEASVNVYDDEFQLDRFRQRLVDIYQPDQLSHIIENFQESEDTAAIGKEPTGIAAWFVFNGASDVDVVEKEKKSASIVTGRLVDTILRARYRLADETLSGRRFVSAVYLYCLRPFAAAYRTSLSPGSAVRDS